MRALARARPSATWACWPPESLATGRSEGIPRAVSRARAPDASQWRLRFAPISRWSAALSRLYRGTSWARYPMLARNSSLCCGARPSAAASPALGALSPVRIFSSVVFPAPFGPTSADLDDQVQPAMFGEVLEVLGVEGRERQAVGQGACRDPGVVGWPGPSPLDRRRGDPSPGPSNILTVGKTITPPSQFSNASRLRRPHCRSSAY